MYVCFSGVITVVALFLPWGESQESQVSLIRTTPSGMLSVCPDVTAIFTCRVTGSRTLVWTSTEYIAGTVEFTTYNEKGDTFNESDNVFAELTQNSDGTLASQLHVRASVDSSISCAPDSGNGQVTVNLAVYNGSPGRPTNVAATEIASADDSCTILVDWDRPTDTPPEDISHYIVHDSINGAHEVTDTSTLVTFPSRECTDNLSFNVIAVDRCSQEGPSSANVKPNFLPPTDPATDSTTPSGTLSTATTTTTTTPTNTSSDPGITSKVVAEVIGSIFGIGLIAVILLVVAAVIWCCRRSKGPTTVIQTGATAEMTVVHTGAKSESQTKDESTREDKKDSVVLHIDTTRGYAAASGPPPPPVDEVSQNAEYAAASGPPPPPVDEVSQYPGLKTTTDGRSIRRRPIGEGPPHLKDVFKMLLPLASRWKTIGELLEVQYSDLDRIRSDEWSVEDCLREMMSVWLKQVNPSPTWKDLADTVETLDSQIALRIRQQYVLDM